MLEHKTPKEIVKYLDEYIICLLYTSDAADDIGQV